VIGEISNVIVILGFFYRIFILFGKRIIIKKCELVIREKEKWEDFRLLLKSIPSPWKIKVVDVGYISETGREISFGPITGNTELQYPNVLKIEFSFNVNTPIKSISKNFSNIKRLYIKDSTGKTNKYRKKIIIKAINNAKRIQ